MAINTYENLSNHSVIYVHSHADNFLSSIQAEAATTLINDVKDLTTKLQQAAITQMQQTYDILCSIEQQLEQQGVTINEGEIIFPKTHPLYNILNQIEEIKKAQASKREMAELKFSSHKRKISDVFDDLYKQMSQDPELQKLLVSMTIDQLKDEVNKYLQQTFNTKTRDFSKINFFDLTRKELLNLDLWKNRVPRQKIQNTIDNMIVNYFVSTYKTQIQTVGTQLLADVQNYITQTKKVTRDFYSANQTQNIITRINQILSYKNNLSSKIGFLSEPIWATKEVQDAIIQISLSNGKGKREVNITGNLKTQDFDALTSDVTSIIKDIETTFLKDGQEFTLNSIGLSVKSTSYGQRFRKTMDVSQDEEFANVQIDQSLKSIKDKKQFYYIIENYLALSRYGVTKGDKYKYFGERIQLPQEYDLVSQFREAVLGYGLLKALLGYFFTRDISSFQANNPNNISQAIQAKGLPLLLAINNKAYKMSMLLKNLIQVIKDRIDPEKNVELPINLSYGVGTKYNITNLQKLAYQKRMTPPNGEQYASDDENYINQRIDTLWDDDKVSSLMKHLQMDDESFKKIILKNVMISFDAEQLYKI